MANTRKIITGITEDVRIIIIKLADRLHNMRTLQYKSEFKQKENSLETMDIFVPLAYYIGAYRIKSELSYYRLYLLRFLKEQEDERANDDEFIDARADAAEIEYEERRRDGLTVDQAQELAMAVLLEGFD